MTASFTNYALFTGGTFYYNLDSLGCSMVFMTFLFTAEPEHEKPVSGGGE